MWSTPIDLYCERVGAAFWAEPVNAVSNLAFLIAALAAFRLWRQHAQIAGRRDWPALVLIGVVALVGLGSFAFHTLATRGAMLLDVVPIGFFIYGYLALALARFLRLRRLAVALAVFAFIGLTHWLVAVVPRAFLNGSVGYLPALAAMAAVGVLVRGRAVRIGMLAAAATFIASLAFRIVDPELCAAFPAGTHFAWHILNAVVLYILLRTAIAARADASRSGQGRQPVQDAG